MNATRFAVHTTKSFLRLRHHLSGFQTATTTTITTTAATAAASENGEKYHKQQHSKKQQQKKAKYLLPKRIILLRHGESLGNVDDTAYANIPDWKIPLTRRGERQALHTAKQLSELLDGETLFTYCSPYQRAIGTWEIIEEYIFKENETIKRTKKASSSDGATDTTEDNDNNNTRQHGVEIIGMREEPRVAEQQFGNFQNPHKVRTAKAERRTFGRFFFRFPNGESGLDVYSRCSSFLATLSRDIKQIDQRYSPLHRSNMRKDESVDDNSDSDNLCSDGDKDAMEHMNILVVCHGLTLRLLLMRYFQLTVEEFENSYNSQNAKLVIMDRFVYDDNDSHVDPGNRKYYCTYSDSLQYREYYRLDDTAKEALNLLGDVSNKRPVYQRALSKLECGILSVDGDAHLLEE